MGKLLIVSDYCFDATLGIRDNKHKIVLSILQDVINYDISKVVGTFLFSKKLDDVSEIDLNNAYHRVKEVIEEHKPTAILLLGEHPLRSVMKKEFITKQRGKAEDIAFMLSDGAFHEIPTIATFSPTYVQNAAAQLKPFAEDIQKATLMADGFKVTQGKKNTQIVLCKTLEEVEILCEYIKEAGRCCFDFETHGDMYQENFGIDTIAFSFQHGSSYVIPLEHFDTPFNLEELVEITKLLKEEIFENELVSKTNQHLKYELHCLAYLGIKKVAGRLDDTMLIHHLLFNSDNEAHGLKDFAPKWFKGYENYEANIKKWKWGEIPLKELTEYTGIDTDVTLRCTDLFLLMLMEDERLYLLYRNLVMAVFKPLFEAETNGMLVGREDLLLYIKEGEELLAQAQEALHNHRQVRRFISNKKELCKEETIKELQAKIDSKDTTQKKNSVHTTRWAKRIQEIKTGVYIPYDGFNFNSDDQLSELLYSKEGFGFKKLWDRKKKQETDSTSKKFLNELNDKSGFVEELLLYRSLAKIVKTYLLGVYKRLDKNARVHTSLSQIGTGTGRLASKNPNLQNLPNAAKLKSDIAVRIVGYVKKMFIAPALHSILQADYSQAELRAIADYANEETMLDAYERGLDLHALTAANMLKVTVDEFYKLPKDEQKQWRTRAKAGNFGLIYGMGAKGFMDYAKQNYGVVFTEKEAEQVRVDFFKLYKRLPEYHNTYINKCKKHGYVRTMFGRKRWLPDIYSPSEFTRGMAERAAINTPIQGTAGEFTLFAIALLRLRLNPRVKLANTVHDSIIYYVPNDLVEETAKMIKLTCENLPTEQYFKKQLKRVRMEVDIELSTTNWKELEPYKIILE